MKVEPFENTDIDWKFEVSVDIGCNARIWMFFIISLCLLAGLVAFAAFLFFLVCCCALLQAKMVGSTTGTPATQGNLNGDAENKSHDDAQVLLELSTSSSPNFQPKATAILPCDSIQYCDQIVTNLSLLGSSLVCYHLLLL